MGYFMLFCQVWIDRRVTASNLTKPQTFSLEKPRGSASGLRYSLVFWMNLYKDYIECAHEVSVFDCNAYDNSACDCSYRTVVYCSVYELSV